MHYVECSVSELDNVKMEKPQTLLRRIQLPALVLAIIGCNCWIGIHGALGAKKESPEKIDDDTGKTLRCEMKFEAACWCMLKVRAEP